MTALLRSWSFLSTAMALWMTAVSRETFTTTMTAPSLLLLSVLSLSQMTPCVALPDIVSRTHPAALARSFRIPRGGAGFDDNAESPPSEAPPSMYYDFGNDQTQDNNLYQQQGAELGSEGPPSTYGGIDPSVDAFQDHIDAWKTKQQSIYGDTASQASVRDETGRVKLLVGVSKGYRAVVFFIMLWRDVHLYETADTSFPNGLTRTMLVLPTCVLMLANLAGAVTSITSPHHKSKKRLKTILNLNKLVEVLLIIYYFGRLTLFPPKAMLREVYVANILHSVFFLMQSQSCTRLNWDDSLVMDGTTNRPATEIPAASATASPPSPLSAFPPQAPPRGRNPYPAYYGATSGNNNGNDILYDTQQQQQQQQQQGGPYYTNDDVSSDNNRNDGGYRY